jgi:Protein of unknown function (DUF2924)
MKVSNRKTVARSAVEAAKPEQATPQRKARLAPHVPTYNRRTISERALASEAKAADDARAAPAAPDARLPAPGTVLQKRDRHGAVRCECTVEEGGFRYAGEVYRSLSAAAMAAAKGLGLQNKTQNGWAF